MQEQVQAVGAAQEPLGHSHEQRERRGNVIINKYAHLKLIIVDLLFILIVKKKHL